MALKFLNKKGWHTGSLRNIENVWKAEQKRDAEQKKLEELRKQIQEERERSEFRQLQEQAGLVPRQERLEFLYDSGLAVGKGSSSSGSGSGFKSLESVPKQETTTSTTSGPSSAAPAVPGALFEDKPQSANDAWRKLHSDPLLLIRQREQEALARIKNNPVQMAMIRKSVEEKKDKARTNSDKDEKEARKEHRHRKSRHKKHSMSDHPSVSGKGVPEGEEYRNIEEKAKFKVDSSLKHGSSEASGKDKISHRGKHKESDVEDSQRRTKQNRYSAEPKEHRSRRHQKTHYDEEREDRKLISKRHESSDTLSRHESNKRRNPVKLSEEERAARLREMQMDAELHEEQRWKRIKKAEENDAREANHARMPGSRNFLDAAQKSVYGAEKGGSSTIEESVRRRTHYLQGRSEAEGNAFRR